MTFETPISFLEAVKHLLSKDAMPTGLDSGGLRQLDSALRRQSLFSAQTTMERYLEDIRSTVGSVLNPTQREDGTNEGFNPATAREELRNKLVEYGYEPNDGEDGTIKDLSSDGRLNLVVKTNTELAQGAGKFVQANANEDVVDLWPAWELIRYEDRDVPRNWDGGGTEKKGSPFGSRWMLAAQTSGDSDAARILDSTGRMVALKSSGIWQALGDGAGGFDDTLGNPYPPFAFNSGMWTEDVSRDEAVELGLIGQDEQAEPAAFDLASLFAAP